MFRCSLALRSALLPVVALALTGLSACTGGGGSTPIAVPDPGNGGMIQPPGASIGAFASGALGSTCNDGFVGGLATGYSSQSEASTAAINQCINAGGSKCGRLTTFGSGSATLCAALVVGNNERGCRVNPETGPTLSGAEAAARAECRNDGYSNCEVVRSECATSGPASAVNFRFGLSGGGNTGGGNTDGNRAPVVRGGFSDVSNMTVGRSVTVGVADRFSDPDGDRLTYSASSSAAAFVRASISGSTLTFTAVQAFTTGAATITVTARDPGGLTAEIRFDVTGATGGNTGGGNTDGNRAPVVRGGFSDVSNMTVGRSVTVGVADRFSDPDGDRLTYSASSSAAAFVRASISGSTLTFTAVQAFTTGAATITVTARDPGGLTAEIRFDVTGATGGNTGGGGSTRYFGEFRWQPIESGCPQRFAGGNASGRTSESAARTEAMNQCRRAAGRNCGGYVQYGSAYGQQCYAVFRGETRSSTGTTCGAGAGTGTTQAAAETAARNDCRASFLSCTHFASGCGR